MDARRGPFDDFAVATGVLTRLPVERGGGRSGAVAASGWAFPLVGAGIGAVCAFAYLLAGCRALRPGGGADRPRGRIRRSPAPFHEDGLADTADGFGGGRDRDEKLAIMRDSRHGTFGILALVLSMGLRAAALAALGDPIHVGLALMAAHAASRGELPWLMRLLGPARPRGWALPPAGRPWWWRSPVRIGGAIALAMLGPLDGIDRSFADRRRVDARGNACAAADRRLHRRCSRLFPANRRDRDAARGGRRDQRRFSRNTGRRPVAVKRVAVPVPARSVPAPPTVTATTTRFWWVRHAPVDHERPLYGRKRT